MLEHTSLLLLCGGVIALFGVLRPVEFLQWSNFANIFGSQAVLVVLTLALLWPLRAGDYDLSVAGILTLASMVTAVLDVRHGWSLGAIVVVVLLVGAAVGAVNAFVTVVVGVDSLIATLGTGTIAGGLTLLISDSSTVTGMQSDLSHWVVGIAPLGIAIEFYYGLALALVVWAAFDLTVGGRRLLVVGRGREVARLSGIAVSRIRWIAFIVGGVLAALAGILYAGTSGGADPTSGASLLLPAFAAAYLGTTVFKIGDFNPFGSLLAVYFLAIGVNGLSVLGVEGYAQNLFYGTALIVAVSMSLVWRRRTMQTEGRA
ncbi:MAG TPA: ABC transporter permease [Capillimicrobium sp.]|nr:ABC transporter permease [Capillimicrobium sp.]